MVKGGGTATLERAKAHDTHVSNSHASAPSNSSSSTHSEHTPASSKQQTRAAPNTSRISTASRGLSVIGRTTGLLYGFAGRGRRLIMLDALNQMILKPLSGVEKIPFIGKMFTPLSSLAEKPDAMLGKVRGVKVGDLENATSNLLSGVENLLRTEANKTESADSKKGQEPGLLARGLSHVVSKINDDKRDQWSERAGSASARVKNVEGKVAERISKGSNRLFGNLADRISGEGFLSNLSGKASGFFTGRAGKQGSKATALIDKLPDALKGTSHVDALKTALEANNKAGIDDALKNIKDVAKGLPDNEKISRSDEKVLNALEVRAEKTAELSKKAGKFGNLGDTVRNVPKSISEMSLGQAALKGAFILGTTFQVLHTLKDFKNKIQTLKKLNTELTGEKTGAARILLGWKLSPAVKALRKEALFTQGLDLAVQGAETAAASFLRPQQSMTVLVAGQFISNNLRNFQNMQLQGKQGLKTLMALQQKVEQGGLLTTDDTVILLQALSKDAAALSSDNPVLRGPAERYAKDGLNPLQIAGKIFDETFHNDALAVYKASNKTSAVESAVENDTPFPAHRKERDVLGQFTGQVVEEAQKAALGRLASAGIA